MALDLSALEAEVSRDADVDSSASTLITALAAEIEANKADPVALQGLADRLKAQSDALAAAVAQNTPASPDPGTGDTPVTGRHGGGSGSRK